MKPTKNRIFCPSCNRTKILFRSAKAAWLFISYNHDDILMEEGYAPVRAYRCPLCAGWHVTSKETPNECAERRTKRKRKPSPVVNNPAFAECSPSGRRSEVFNRKINDVIGTIRYHRRMMESITLDLNTLPLLDRAREYITYSIGRLVQKTHRMNDENKAELAKLKTWWQVAEKEYKANTRLVRLLKCCQDNIYIGKKSLEQYDLVTFSDAFAKAKQMLEVAIKFPGMADEKRQCMSGLESLADSLDVMRQSA